MVDSQFFLWNDKALYVGQGLDSTFHQHYAVQIGISLAQPFRVRCHLTDSSIPIEGFIADPNIPHQIDAAVTPSVFLWIEATSEIAQTIYDRSSIQCLHSIPIEHCQSVQTFVRSFQQTERNCQDANVLLNDILHLIGTPDGVATTLDERINVAITRIQQADLTELTKSPNQLAGESYLSHSRFRHLFQNQLGISVRRYLLWQRLMVALQNMTEGISLTHAAHTAGFADAAHMTRTFRKMFGIKPSDVFKDSHFVQVIFCE